MPSKYDREKQAKRAAMSSFFGGALEYYDFYIYTSAAALIFPTLFFSKELGTSSATLASLATLGVGYLARPVGAIVFGHIGDRVGRKSVLVATLALMGVATTVIGFLPTYASVGVLAPALLVVCRLAQGLSAGAETTGASTISMESAPPGRRAQYTAWTQNGNYAGFILASIAWLGASAMPRDVLLSWGWRIPFLASILVALVAFIVRRKLIEPEISAENVKDNAEKSRKPPLVDVFRSHPWQVLRTALVLFQGVGLTIVFGFGLTYATQPQYGIELPYTTMLWVAIVSNATAIVAHPLYGKLSDRIGRRPVMIFGMLGTAVMGFAYFAAVTARNVPAIFLCGILLTGVTLAATTGVFMTFLGEQFDASVRMTGTSVGFQIGMILGGFSPTIAAALIDGTNWLPAAWIIAGAFVIAAAAVFTAPETGKTPLEDLGQNPSRRQSERKGAL